jgi:hypothetical protein
MEREERKEKISQLYKAMAKQEIHVEFKERLKFLKGWSSQQIAATLKRVCTYSVDHPEVGLGRIYAGAFGIAIDGKAVSDLTK